MKKLIILSPIHAAMLSSVLFLASCGGDDSPTAPGGGEPAQAPPADEQPRETTVLEGHEGWVTSVSFSPDGRTLASGGGRSNGSVVGRGQRHPDRRPRRA